jgi:hypothetical protein
MPHRMLVAEIRIEGRQRTWHVPDGVVGDRLTGQVPARDDGMAPRDAAELFRPAQTREGLRICDVLPVGTPGVCCVEVGNPFELVGNLGQGVKPGSGQAPDGVM